MILALLLAAVAETSAWCADRVVGENERGRYAINYIWEGGPRSGGTVVCHPVGACARTDTTGNGVTGGPDFGLLIRCLGEPSSDHIPPAGPQ